MRVMFLSLEEGPYDEAGVKQRYLINSFVRLFGYALYRRWNQQVRAFEGWVRWDTDRPIPNQERAELEKCFIYSKIHKY